MKKEYNFGLIIILVSGLLTLLFAKFAFSGKGMIELNGLQILSVFLHNLGFAFGFGGDLISDFFGIVFRKDRKNTELYLNNILPPFKRLILIGFILMVIIHVGEVISNPSETIHYLKAAVLIPILLGGIYMQFYAIPRLKLTLNSDYQKYNKLEKRFFVVDMIVLLFWIFDFVLNSIFLPTDAFAFIK